MLLGRWYLACSHTPLAAFNRLQLSLMKRFLARGGSLDAWMARIAPVFRERYSWLCEQPVPVPATTAEHRIQALRLARRAQRSAR